MILRSALPKIKKIKNYFQKTYKSTDKPEKKVYYDIVQEELQIPRHVLACLQIWQAYFYTKTLI